jgi:hypothetical protein
MNVSQKHHEEGVAMNSVSQMAEALEKILQEDIEAVGREVGFLKRFREISSADFVQTLIFAWLQEPEIALDGLAQVAERREVSITASALSQRFGPEAASLLQQVLEQLCAQQMQVEVVDIALLRQFSAVVVEDSSSIVLPAELAEVWRGCGGSAGMSDAAIKLFVRWDVLSGRLQGPGLAAGRCNDKRGPFAVDDLAEGSLYVADLGFFSLERLCGIKGRKPGQRGKAKRYFVSRYLPQTTLWTRRGHRIELRGILPQRVGERREIGVLLGASARLPVRLIIERVPQEVGEQRREHLRETARTHGREADEELLALADWTIVLTNVPRRMLNSEQVLVIVRLRWQIERLFRLWKEHGHIDQWRSKKPWRILCELYAKLSAMVIQQWLIQLGCWQNAHRSLVKAAQVVRREAGRIMVALYEGGLGTTLTGIVRCMHSGCQLNTRRQFPNTSQFLLGMPLVWPKRRVQTTASP